MSTKFTPGPWDFTNHFNKNDTQCNCAYVLSDGYAGSICAVDFDNGLAVGEGGNDSPPKDEASANGYLIAAAPDLYALHDAEAVQLDCLLKAVRCGDPQNEIELRITDMIAAKRASLAKAVGRNP